ncbi:hypothetical protein [Ottowia sp. VDI28]|uniref:hypothetical protein n=1 Tax=Ottowia sp. VDI28 TaxID=3133968 RepID=UPI003C302C03
MPTPPSSRSASPARAAERPTAEHTMPMPNVPHGQGRQIRHGNGQTASTLRDGMHDTQQEIGGAHQAPRRPAAPPFSRA